MTEALDLVIKPRSSPETKDIHNVLLKAEKDSNLLNPVSAVWRALGPGNKGGGAFRDAVLLLGGDALEIYIAATGASDDSRRLEQGPAKAVLKVPVSLAHIPRKILHRAKTGALTHTGSEHFVLEDQDEPNSAALDNAVEGHVFSIGVAYSQLLRVRSTDATITLWYHPNTVALAHLSKHPEAKALRFSFALSDSQEAAAVLHSMERHLERYAQAALFLGRRLPFHQLIQMTGVTQVLQGRAGRTETVLLNTPAWEATVPLHQSFAQAGHEQASIRLLLSTPFGAATATVDQSILQRYKKGSTSRFFVSAHIASLAKTLPSVIKRRSELDGAASSLHATLSMSSAAGDDAEETWQPDSEDAEETNVQVPAPSRLWSKGTASALQEDSQAWQIRIHCYALASRSEAAGTPMKAPSHQQRAAAPSGDSIHMPYFWTAALLAVLALAIGLSHSFMANLASLLSFGALAYALSVNSQQKKSQSDLVQGADGPSGPQWSLTLIKPEFTQEAWQDSGDSTELGSSAHVEVEHENSEAAQAESWPQKLGLTEDQWQRFMTGFHQDELAARRAARASKEWRAAHKLPEDSSRQLQPNFEEIKSWFRHGVLTMTHDGSPVWLMKVGDMKKGWGKFKASSLSNYDINRHLAFCMDYLYNHLDSRELPNGRCMWIIDLKGMGMTDIGSDAFNFGKQIAQTIGSNFPERVSRIFIVHVPGFFSLLWRIVEPMLAANTRRKIRLLRSQGDMLREMREEMDEADIPSEYGGKSIVELYDTKAEVATFQYVRSLS